ncbi:autotransporter domain-containing protein [Sutterella wadsworthensis]|uniref:autotransporter domain-containing protein n=1 Tax=Sutterella wadsworthensis TaxID=40545 RepID=UPI0024204975|nr:autotransporter domain-containing protein [Sutterella wadsworthensis]
MNKTFKTIWNAVRGAYVTVNETVCGANQKSGSVKLAVLTVAAAAALSAGDVVQASPDYVTSKVGDFNLSKQDEGDALDLIASKILLDEQSGATDGTVQFTFAGANVAAIQAVNGFSGFDKTNVGSISDIFSGAAGIHVRSTKADNNSFTLNNVNVTVGMQAGVSESELFGVWHDSGIVTVSDAATISVSNDATDIAMGYAFDSIHDNERPTPSSRQTTFTDTASISASSSVDGAWAAGIYMRANALDKPSLTFKKDAEISAHAASGEAGGIILNYSDYDSNNSTDGAQGGSVVFEDTSALTVEASGKAAVGVLVDVGSLIVNGKADIKASGTKNEYGIVIRGHGKATFNGETEVKAKNALVLTPEDELDGLNWANNEIYNFGYQTPRQPVAEFNGKTTLNGKVSLGDNTTLKIGGDVTVNGDYVSNGVTSGSGSLTIINGQKTVFTQASNAVSAQTSTLKDINVSLQLGKLTISGGEVTNNANMLISETLAITGNAVFINGSASDGTDDIWVKKITLDEGSTLRQTGGMHFQEGVVGGTWAEESKEFYDLDGNIAGDNTTELLLKLGLEDTDAPAEQKLELAGGHFTTVGSNEKAQVKEVELLKNYSVAYTKGTYDYSKFTVNTDGNRTDGDKNLRIAGASVTTDTLTLTAGSAAVESGSLSAAKLISNGKFEMSVADAGTLAVKSFQGQQNGDFTLIAGKMGVEALDLTSGKLTIVGTATLATSSGQIFKTGLDAEGKGESAGSKNWENLVFTGGTLTLTDEKYNANYADSVKDILGSDTQVTYLGELVGGLTLDQAASIGGVHANTEIDATGNVDNDGTVSVKADVGGKTIDVGSASKVEVTSNTTLTLVGSSGDELINFSSTGDKAVDIQGTLKLGSVSVETSGKLTSTVNVEGTVAVENGSFDLTKLTTGTTSSTTAAIEVNKGSLNVGTLELNNGKATISVSDDAKMKVDELAAKAGEHIITGAVEVGKLAQDAANALIQIGTTGKSGLKGALTIAEGGLKGLKFFLDPTWKDGMEVTDASSLRIAETNVDGQIVVGQNSYVSLGTTDDSAFVQLFNDGTLTWGGENGTLAAVYVAKPITIASTGSLVVDASLETVPANDPTAGSVTFAAGSVLVANVKNFKDGDTAITVDNGASITVAETSKAVVIAEAGQTFQLTSSDDVNKNYWNKAGDTLISANKLVSFNVGADGKITTEAEDAEDVFAGLMQGAALANAGAASDNEAVKSYAEALLTDTTGKKSNAQIAREFDAAMNPAGTLGVFTTAKDRSTELRDAVRAHAGNGTANGLWAQVTGGKTKLKGISTGAQDLDLDTDAYGLAVGGEAAVQNITLGAAFMGGSGKTENDSVAGKDDFNYYGLSLYAKTQVQGIDLEGDLSAAWLKSDLMVGGAADVDTDTTTAVYSLGIQAKKTFNLGVDVTPFIGMDVYHIKSDGFTTNHGVSIEDANATIVEFPIGAEVKKAFQTSSGFSVAPSFSLAVVPTVGSKDIDGKVRFAGAESTYNFTFADDVKVRSQLGIEAQKDNFTLGLAAGYDWGNEERSAASVQLRAKYAF